MCKHDIKMFNSEGYNYNARAIFSMDQFLSSTPFLPILNTLDEIGKVEELYHHDQLTSITLKIKCMNTLELGNTIAMAFRNIITIIDKSAIQRSLIDAMLAQLVNTLNSLRSNNILSKIENYYRETINIYNSIAGQVIGGIARDNTILFTGDLTRFVIDTIFQGQEFNHPLERKEIQRQPCPESQGTDRPIENPRTRSLLAFIAERDILEGVPTNRQSQEQKTRLNLVRSNIRNHRLLYNIEINDVRRIKQRRPRRAI